MPEPAGEIVYGKRTMMNADDALRELDAESEQLFLRHITHTFSSE
jgi:hypothetical protein